jgi:hypothetical protein
MFAPPVGQVDSFVPSLASRCAPGCGVRSLRHTGTMNCRKRCARSCGCHFSIAAHSEGKVRLTAIASSSPAVRLEFLGLVIQFDDRRLGEIAEAIVDFQGPMEFRISA